MTPAIALALGLFSGSSATCFADRASEDDRPALLAPSQHALDPQAGIEVVPDFRRFVGAPRRAEGNEGVLLERVSTGVPWPRGLAVVDGVLVALARGRHRSAGGIDPLIVDRSGALFEIDLDVSEPFIRSEQAGQAVRSNAWVLAEPDARIHNLLDPAAGPVDASAEVDRPYCTLAFDSVSRNFFICGFSGLDLTGSRFRKNAADSILRFDLRDRAWHLVEKHDPSVVPIEELGAVVSNDYYPHHDPARHAAPHGLLNGPDGATVVGDFLYAVGKDNHVLVSYPLDSIRRDPAAAAPPGTVEIEREVDLMLDGEIRHAEVLGPSAARASGDFIYVSYRTTSIVVRYPIASSGALVRPIVGELVAVFEPWSSETSRSANIVDLAFNSRAELFVSCAQEGRVWNVGVPDPSNVYDGVDQGATPTGNLPFLDLRRITGNPKAKVGNITFDPQDRLYVCSGNYDSGTSLAGVIYRALLFEKSLQGEGQR